MIDKIRSDVEITPFTYPTQCVLGSDLFACGTKVSVLADQVDVADVLSDIKESLAIGMRQNTMSATHATLNNNNVRTSKQPPVNGKRVSRCSVQ